jgi:acyl dehydratase
LREDVAVGLVVDEVDFPVEEGKVREFALAVGSRALATVPLTFAAVAAHWRDQSAMVTRLGLDIRRVVVGESSWEHHAPVVVGDRLRGARVLAAIARKPRPNGTMHLLTLQTRLRRGDGELAIVQTDVVIELP